MPPALCPLAPGRSTARRRLLGAAATALGLAGLLTLSPAQAAAPDGDVEWDGIYADTTATFVQPSRVEAGGEVTLRLRAWADDLTGATCKLFYAGAEANADVPMVREDRPAGAPFDYWRCTTRVPAGTGEVYFRFAVTDGADTDYYDAGAPEDDWPVRGMQDEERGFQDFRIYTGLDTPVWSQGATFYQIFPDRFFDGRPRNNRLYPEDCIWYLDFAPASPEAAECEIYAVPPTPEGWKRCEIHEDWAELPNGGPCDYFGGDLNGVTAKLPYLDDLAIDAVYLNPVFRAPSNHKYDTMDYDVVDPRFGGTGALEELTEAVHARGLKIIVDGVFNHVSDLGRFYNGWLNYSRADDTVAGIDAYPRECGVWEAFFAPSESGCQGSPYADWFQIWVGVDEYDVDRDGDRAEPATHTCGWAGLEFMPELDYGHPDFAADSGPRTWLYGGRRANDPAVAAQSVAGKWLADGALMTEGLDGWRLDVPDNAGYFNEGRCNKTATDPTIWQGFRTAVKAVGDDKYISGEIWGDASESGGLAGDWFRQRTYDGVMNYHYFATPVSCLLTGTGVHADPDECRDAFAAMTPNNPAPIDAFDRHQARQMRVYPAAVVFSNQNLLSSHDSARFASRVQGDHRRLRLGMFLQSTLPGAPMIYYGDEIGIGESVAPRDASNEIGRATMPWSVFDAPSPRTETREFQRRLLCLRQQYAPLKRGSFTTLHTHNIDATYAFARFDEQQALVAAMNNSDAPRTLELSVRRLGFAAEVELVDLLTGDAVRAAGHTVRLDMPPYSGRLLAPADIAAASDGCRAPNGFPTADPGDDGAVPSGAEVMLDGRGSTDPEGAPLRFAWYGPNGPVGDEATVRLVGLADGRYTFTLVVDDGVYRDRAEVTWIVGEAPDPEPEPGPEPGEPEPGPEPGEPEPGPEPGEPEPGEPEPSPGEPEPSPGEPEPSPDQGDMGVGQDGGGSGGAVGCVVGAPGGAPTPAGWLVVAVGLLIGLRRRR